MAARRPFGAAARAACFGADFPTAFGAAFLAAALRGAGFLADLRAGLRAGAFLTGFFAALRTGFFFTDFRAGFLTGLAAAFRAAPRRAFRAGFGRLADFFAFFLLFRPPRADRVFAM